MPKLDDFIGQTAIKDLLRPKIQLARATRIALPHLLLCGEKELGKMAFAVATAEELQVQFTSASAKALLKTLGSKHHPDKCSPSPNSRDQRR